MTNNLPTEAELNAIELDHDDCMSHWNAHPMSIETLRGLIALARKGLKEVMPPETEQTRKGLHDTHPPSDSAKLVGALRLDELIRLNSEAPGFSLYDCLFVKIPPGQHLSALDLLTEIERQAAEIEELEEANKMLVQSCDARRDKISKLREALIRIADAYQFKPNSDLAILDACRNSPCSPQGGP